MNAIKGCLSIFLLVFLCGCFDVTDELTINADGSGSVKLDVKSGIPNEMAQTMGMGMGGGDGEVMYPPTSEAEARKFFPGKEFTVTATHESSGDGGTHTVITATFKNINALLTSPYGRAHALSLKIENGTLVCKALTGMEAAARFAEMKDETGEMQAELAMLGDMQKKKLEMKDEFRITLPNAVSASNGKQDGKSVSWGASRAQITNAADFIAQLGKVLEASCSADGLKMSPTTPPRMALSAFKDLTAGAVASTTAAPDAKKIAEAAKFVPYAVYVSRTLDLSGGGDGGENTAQLVGAIVLPHEFAPQKWGEAKLDEVVDPKGASLKLKEDDDNFRFSRFSRGMMNDEVEDQPVNTTEERRTFTFEFRPPDWKTKEIARIKGSISLHYFGGMQLLKLSNAIPANWILSQEKMMSSFSMMNSGEKIISDPGLKAIGLSLECEQGMVMNGMTMLGLGVKGGKADVAEIQVFDADGKAWPTVMTREDMGDENSLQVMVAGQPKAPLSLGLLVSSSAATVDVPVNLEHVPIMGK